MNLIYIYNSNILNPRKKKIYNNNKNIIIIILNLYKSNPRNKLNNFILIYIQNIKKNIFIKNICLIIKKYNYIYLIPLKFK